MPGGTVVAMVEAVPVVSTSFSVAVLPEPLARWLVEVAQKCKSSRQEVVA